MTSMPASRRARAMILAPRSWPSKPGLATTTRILRAVAVVIGGGRVAPALENGRLRIRPEDLLHGGDHLALGGAGAGGGDDRLHQVALGRGDPLQLGQRAGDGGAVAAGAGGGGGVGLLAFEPPGDLQDRGRLFVLLDEVVGADDDPLALVDLLLVGEGGIGDLALGVVAADRLDHPPQLVDALEVAVGG